MYKPLSKYILFSLIIAILTIWPLAGSKVFAQADFCNPAEKVFKGISKDMPKDVRNTNVNVGASTLVDTGFIIAQGTEWGNFMGCADYVANLVDDPKVKSALEDGQCVPSEDETCESITNQFKTNEYYEENASGGDNRSHVQGGLLGLAYRIENAVTKEPIPVNMAYFFKDYAKRLPVVGEKVMAADYIDYQHSLIGSVLSVWKMFAAVAYGIMALVLVYVGITIIMRKQVNQKVVVTVQYSLPKVLLALILIAFSYPIGATITSLSWSLWNSAPTIWINLNELMGGPDYESILLLSLGGLLIMGVAAIATLSPLALGVALIMTIVTVVLVLLYLWALVKALYIYIKMLIAIVTAPLVFAMGAIPGNEDKTTEWFKRMIAYGLSIFAIHSVIFLTQAVTFSVVSETLGENLFAGSLMAIFGSNFLLIFGFAFAGQVPTHVENAIIGKPTGGRR